jgi:hypothetical protein
MPLSVANSPAGGGLSNLLRQTRPLKSGDEAGTVAANEPAGTTALRQLGRNAIDSTGSNTAGMKAALTVYLSPLGNQADPGPDKTPPRSGAASTAATLAPRSGASDLLKVLDAYAADAPRLSA